MQKFHSQYYSEKVKNVFVAGYSTGQVLFPITAQNPHQLNRASKKQNPEKKRRNGLQLVLRKKLLHNNNFCP